MKLDARIPRAAGRQVDTTPQSTSSSSAPPTNASTRSSSSAPASPVARPPPAWVSSATRSRPSVTRTAPGGPTRSPPRAASTPPRTTRTTATPSFACSTTPSRAATSGRARPTSTGWPSLSTNIIDQAWPRACPLPASTAATWPTAPSAAPRFADLLRPRARPGSSSCSGAYSSLSAQVAAGTVELHPRTEMLDLVVVDGHARGIVVRDMVTGEVRVPRRRRGAAVHRRLLQRLLPVDQRQGLQRRRRPGAPTSAAPGSPTRATRRSIRPASRSPGTISRSSP